MRHFWDHYLKRIVALLLVFGLYWAARLPSVSEDERRELASRYAFTGHELPTVQSEQQRQVRPVNPSLKHIDAWISSVGAAIALTDLDGDQLSNDVCVVDTRTDHVVITPVPESGERYETFVLNPGAFFDRKTMCPTGFVPDHINEDGLNDIVVYYWGRTPIAFLQRPPADEHAKLAAEQFVACEIVPGNERWFTNAATRADVDGDGHVDLIIGNYFQDGARILDASADTQESMQHSMSRAFNAGTNRILLWQAGQSGQSPGVQFREATGVFDIANQPVANGWTLSVAAGDLDGDQLPEIYFGNDFGPDRFLHNRSEPGKPRFALLTGRRHLSTPSSKVIGCDSFKGMGADFGDLNGDGQLDI